MVLEKFIEIIVNHNFRKTVYFESDSVRVQHKYKMLTVVAILIQIFMIKVRCVWTFTPSKMTWVVLKIHEIQST